MFETVQQLLRSRIDDDSVAMMYEGRTWTWREHLAEAAAEASALIAIADPSRPMHVGALLGNTPAMLRSMAAAALGGYVLCGINTTRRGDGLATDIKRADCQLVLVDAHHLALLDGLDLGSATVIDVDGPEYRDAVATAKPLVPHREVDGVDPVVMLFTSGTSGDPKAVRFAHAMAVLCGASLAERFELTTDDVCYLSMPLFHSNGVAAGWSVALACGATMVPAKFSPSRFLSDIRRYGVTYMNYVGKPLALVLGTPEKPDDADNTLRAAFGNEATDRDVDQFARRFGCKVVDSFGSSEFAVVVMREDGCPPGSIGKGYPGVSVYHADTVTECAPAVFDENGALANFDDAVGELVNTYGVGGFTGYYNDAAATEERMRHGMYWSGDLAYRDADGWIYLAGRTADWMRVDGENLAAGPIERILQRLPQINHVAVYAVPDEHVGDQVMAAVVLNDGGTLTPRQFEDFLASQQDLSPKAWPRYVRINDDLPQTATNKILKRTLIQDSVSAGDGVLWTRGARGRNYTAGEDGAMTAPLPPEGFYPIASGLPVEVAPARAFVPQPKDDPFYTYSGSTPLEQIPPGTVLATRGIPYHILGFPTPLKTTQLLYRSTGQTGKPTVNVTSVIQPLRQPDTTRILSYQSAYDSLNRNDQPSYAINGGLTFGGLVPSVELAVFGLFIARGFTVIVPDTEGQRADFAAGPEYGMNTLDSIRAAFNASAVETASDANVALLGYSGGAIASEWAAELAPTYAPDVNAHLVGAAIGGVLVHPAHNLHYVENTYIWAGVMPMALIGIARAFEVDFTPYLTPRGLDLYRSMQNSSIVHVLGQRPYWRLRWTDVVIPDYPTPESLPLFVTMANQLIMGTGGTPTVPLFIGQGANGIPEGTPGNKPGIGRGDGVMIAGDVRTLARNYCARGTVVYYDQYDLLSHTSAVGIWLMQAIDWINDRFAGQPAPNNCASIPVGKPLDPIPSP